MGKQHAELDERLTEFILDHPIFFVAHRAVPAALGRGPGQVSASSKFWICPAGPIPSRI